ncbi:surfeit locus protein 6-domain-containing protein [Pyronema omphalodes]|nr:surfeit locus protein 6-domain-containing protein [Pyronema omphalodes]
MSTDIEARLKNHASAFDSLLSLIPANKYFEGDNSSQWNKRKQSKEERKSAKKAKLDPDSVTSAAEVRQKRLHDETEGASGSDAEVETEPAQKKQKANATPKKQTKATDKQQPGSEKKQKEKKTPNKKQQENSNTTPAKSPANKKGKAKPSDEPAAAQSEVETPATAEIEVEVREKAPNTTKENEDNNDNDNDNDNDDVMDESIQVNGFADLVSEPTSPNSTAPPTTTSSPTASSKPAKPPVSAEEKAAQKARLAARIEALRASRKADNVDGSNARSRSELMEARRKKEALRKERKKAARLVAKSQAEEGNDEAAATSGEAAGSSSSGKPNPVSVVKNFSFGMVTWDDGAQTTADLADFKKEKKKVGPRDIMGQLKKTEAKNKRIAQMSDEKREVVLEKEKWAKAIKQAQGEKVKDDEKLLKKALKRQEATKRKSSNAWTERLAGQAKAKSERIKKREDNIQARKDAKKNGKSAKKVVHKKGGKPSGKNKKGGRPGFEGGMKLGGKGIPNGKGKK